jgi:cation diffusion facilitator CzcD-associated flavoprotein CzcO
MPATDNPVDVLIIGAGLSGIGAARHLQDKCPGKTFQLVEQRDAIGGTWDIFRYPGVRSDSDMHTLGYNFKPWISDKSIADGPSILAYVREAASETGVDQHILFGHKAVHGSWSTEESLWTCTFENVKTGEEKQIKARFVYGNTGYYSYERGFVPDFPGADTFKGQILEPQFWPENLDYSGKRVVIIGSGATAVTMLPAMTDNAEHVTMLQRTPTYMASVPEVDPIAIFLKKYLGEKRSYKITRWKNATQQAVVYHLSQRAPKLMRKLFMGMVKKQLPEVDVDTHFNPPYGPWDQRLCAIPDGDLFKAIRKGKASVSTGHIETFTENGIQLKSGEFLEADIIVAATGLSLVPLGGVSADIDGKPVDVPSSIVYKGFMLSDLPNFAFTVGYTNSSWTLKADLVADYVCRILNEMDATGSNVVVPRNDDPTMETGPLLDFRAGYVLRAIEGFPKAGSRKPWKMSSFYHLDNYEMRNAKVDDGVLRFETVTRSAEANEPEAVAV